MKMGTMKINLGKETRKTEGNKILMTCKGTHMINGIKIF
jgi:hypothetical protein